MLHLLLLPALAQRAARADQIVQFFDSKLNPLSRHNPPKEILASGSTKNAPTVVTNPEIGASAEYKLIYMTLRGLGDLPHLCAEFYGLKYSMLHVGAADMKALKPLLPFGRVPVLLAPGGNGKTFALAQSDAIVRHLYRKASSGVQASTPLLFSPMAEEHLAMADMWYEQVKESFGTGPWGKAFNISALREGTAADLEAAPTHYRETRNGGTYTPFEASIVALRTFEEQIRAGGGTLTGGAVSYADLALFLQLWELVEEDNFPAALSQLQLPHLRDFVAELAANKQVAGYLAHRRMPRNAPWDGGYATFKPGRTVLQAKDEL